MTHLKNVSRRQFLSGTGSSILATTNVGLGFGTMLSGTLLPASPALANTEHNRFLFIFLTGGWDSALATDPVVGTKVGLNSYDTGYSQESSQTVPGKSELIVGSGLLPAVNAFTLAPTAFVNGLVVEVTAHDLASRYLMTGQFTLSRTSDQPAFVATMGALANKFPAHVVLGGGLPLGSTASSDPPLVAVGLEGLQGRLTPPGEGYGLTAKAMESINRSVSTLNRHNQGSVSEVTSDVLRGFRASEQSILPLYTQGFASSLKIDQNLRQRYDFTSSTEQAGKLGSAFLVLKSGLSRFVSVTMGSYDTHTTGALL